MDPFTALGLATSIAQFLDYSTKVFHGAKEIYQSTSGMTLENQSLEDVAKEMRRFSLKFDLPTTAQQTDDERALCRLAKECKILSDEIIDLLKKLVPRDPKSKRSSIFSALKNLWNEKDKRELERRLDSYRSQLHLQLDFMTSSETKTRLKNLALSAKSPPNMLNELQKCSDELRKGVTLTSISPEAKCQLETLLGHSEDVRKVIAQRHIRKSLSFPDIRVRFDTVSKAHHETFEWIFHQKSKAEDYAHRTRNGERLGEPYPSIEEVIVSFNNWLSFESGIFHVSGKLGSGKSTLMKFLCRHPKTLTKLQEWAGGKTLIFANFFFWRPGTRLQKSLVGLQQSLLHDILQSCPELIPEAFPDQWRQLLSEIVHTQEELCVSEEEIREAFTKLIHRQDIYKTHCFCFFIDGLDEYEETCQDDYKSMVRLLQGWTCQSSGGVKICVSSRQDNVFQNAFSAERRLCLQDLTRKDMERYVEDKLKEIENQEEKYRLVWKITERSDGIFLWVALVVKALRQCLEDGYDISRFESELASLPAELESLFEYLLRTISKSVQMLAYQIFNMVSDYGDLSLLSLSFLDNYTKDRQFATEPSFLYTNLSDTDRTDREQKTSKLINGYCRGLIEVRGGKTEVTYTHRSIPEFLKSMSAQTQMRDYLEGFCSLDAVCQLWLAELRALRPDYIKGISWSSRVHTIIRLRDEKALDSAPYRFLSCLDSEMTSKTVMPLDLRIPFFNGYGPSLERSPSQPVYPSITVMEPGLSSVFVTSPLYISAYIGQFDYVAWKIQHDQTLIENRFKRALLLNYMATRLGGCRCLEESFLMSKLTRSMPESLDTEFLGGTYVEVEDVEDVKDIIATTHLMRSVLEKGQSLDTESLGATWLQKDDPIMHVWRFTLCCIVSCRIGSSDRTVVQALGELIAIFLQIGADPRLLIRFGEKLHRYILISHRGKHDIRMHGENAFMSTKRPASSRSAIEEQLKEKGGTVALSFRDFIKFWDFDNREEILDFMEKRTEPSEEVGEKEATEQLESDESVASVSEDLDIPGHVTTQQIESKGTSEHSGTVSMDEALKSTITWREWRISQSRGYVFTFSIGILLTLLLIQLFRMMAQGTLVSNDHTL